ncbi:hypothetical protein [Streptomyces sp. RK9]
MVSAGPCGVTVAVFQVVQAPVPGKERLSVAWVPLTVTSSGRSADVPSA